MGAVGNNDAPGVVPDETFEASGGGGRELAAGGRELAAGAMLGKYRLERVLGTGGMGVVWAARDPDLERDVALKVLRTDSATPELRRRLLREARAMARLKHPNVLTVYEVDSDGDRDFIAMELVEGASLDHWLAGRPPHDELWRAALAAGRGLAAAHRAGIVHRDFKPHNVLRSHDGRVLVTDFGLARGHGDEATATTLPGAPVGAVDVGLETTLDATPGSLDAPLTHTGAMMGTPAYMAPEQFLGAACDPRTDQFAYCVTAWQMFAGERPFRGDTLEELRRAAGAGVAEVKAALPGALRAVLARGLAPDPAARWADMNALLAALERAQTGPRRHRQLAFAGGGGLALAAMLAWTLVRPADASYSATCELAPADEMARAWSPALRARLAARYQGRSFQRAADELDAFAAAWTADYARACASPRATRTFARLGCLLGERDEVAGIAELIPTVPASGFDDVEMAGVLPRPQACDGEAPVTPPTLPDDPAKRARIRALRPRFIASRFVPNEQALATMPALLAEAEAIGWDPILAEAHQYYALAAHSAKGRWELARDQFKLANELARRSHHYHLEADTWIHLLETELDAATDPGDPTAFAALAAQARVAVHNAGDDPAFLAGILRIEGKVARTQEQLDAALAKYEQARAMELASGNVPAWARHGIDVVEVLLARDRPGDAAAAWQLMLDADRVAAEHGYSDERRRPLAATLMLIAQVRGDLALSHRWADRLDPPAPPPAAIAIAGRVVDGEGRGVAGATVVAWTGTLHGDATRVYQAPGFTGDVVATGPDGAFTVRAVRGGGIIAELGDRRARPQLIGDGAPVLALAPTHAVAGRVDADDELLTGVVVSARYELARDLAWRCVAQVDRQRGYRLAGLTPGDATLRLDSWVDANRPTRKLDAGPVRDGAVLRWPVGPAIDAIVRGAPDPSTIYLVRGAHTAKTRGDLDRLVDGPVASLIHPALVVGIGDRTAEGIAHYQRGDRHAVLLGNAPGAVTVCATGPDPTSPARCQTVDVPALDAPRRDGRGIYPAIPVVFAR